MPVKNPALLAMKAKLPLLIFTFIVALFFGSCANMVPPSGGPRDTDPPEVVSCSPPNGTVNFKPQRVEITFNEFIRFSNIQQKVLISPPVKQQPRFDIRGKSVVFNMEAPLEPNTTYNIYFGSSIADITEGNQISNYRYTFSTGDYIDSLILFGTTHDALSHEEKEGRVIMLYKEANDSLPLTTRPFYVAKTDEQGHFLFENLAPGEYKLFGLEDENNNYLYDLPTEWIAFSDTLVSPGLPVVADTLSADSLTRDTLAQPPHMEDTPFPHYYGNDTLILRFFQEVDSIQRVEKSEAINPYVYRFTLRFPPRTLQVSAPELPPHDTLISRHRKEVTLYFREPIKERAVFLLSDAGYQWNDTIRVSAEKKEKEPPSFLNNIQQNSIPFFQPLTINSPKPIKRLDTSKFVLTQATDTIKDTIPFALKQKCPASNSKVLIDISWNGDSKYELTIYPGAITLVDGRANDTLKKSFSIKGRENFGSIAMDVKGQNEGCNYIVQLLDANKEVARQIRFLNEETARFKHLNPGKYNVRVIRDQNHNGQWDTGDYFLNKQPEKVWYYPTEINVRANWEIQEKMNLKELPY